MTRRRILALTALSSLALAAPAAAEVAPGRVVFPLTGTARLPSVDPFALEVGVAHPDGRTTMMGSERGKGVVLAQLRPDGTLDPSFGTAGIAHVPVPFGSGYMAPRPLQVLRQADGRLVLVVAGSSNSKYELPQLRFVRVLSDGRLDSTFGNGGIATPGIQGSCDNCSPAALQPDGSIVFTGNTGQVPATIEHDPTVKPDFHWVVARLTPSGALDQGFGQQGVVTLPGAGGTGNAVTVLPGGAIGVLGRDNTGPKVARVTALGGLDPAFNGGAPESVPGSFNFVFSILGHPSGSLDVLGTRSGSGQVLRFTPTGALDATFGDNGAVTIKSGVSLDQLLPAPDGGDLVAGATTFNPQSEPVALRVSRISPTGAVTKSADVPVRFGGGLASVYTHIRAPKATSLDGQSGFHAGRAFARPDGGVVLPGAVGVVEYTGEGAGYEIERAGVAAITPDLALDPTFGGPLTPAKFSVSVPGQRAALDASKRLLRVSLVVKSSGPGLALLTVKSGKTVLARSTAPVYFTGTQRVRAFLTLTGRRVLKRAHHVRVSVSASFRSLVGANATARARGTLR
jgi:uncharacterized delta-60 repeat protein